MSPRRGPITNAGKESLLAAVRRAAAELAAAEPPYRSHPMGVLCGLRCACIALYVPDAEIDAAAAAPADPVAALTARGATP